MPALAVTGAYCSVEGLRRSVSPAIADTSRDEALLEHLEAASREIERATLRRFFPVTAMNAYRWPPFHIAATWEVWTEDDLLSVSSLQVAAAGQNAVPVTLTHYFLEPQQHGPPYNRVEVDLSSTDVFQSGPTPQQSVQITGQWGYSATTVGAGTLAAAITTTTGTSITVSNGSLIEQGNVLLIGSEALYVGWQNGATGAPTLTVQRGVNGTTAATHLISAPISVYQAPATIRRLVREDARGVYQRELASWGQSVGMGEAMIDAVDRKRGMEFRDRVVAEYARRRTAAV